MDITPQDTTQQSISDDQELAKALAGVMPDAPEPDPTPNASAPATTPAADTPLQFEETPVTSTPPAAPATPAEQPALPQPTVSPTPGSDLESIKKDALGELRPLIGKVELPAEEKFDTYLMLIRSTDDTSLIEPAHAAAQGIADEKRRAEALLEIIKEIDFLSHKDQTPQQ